MSENFLNEVEELVRQAVREHSLSHDEVIGLAEEALAEVLTQDNGCKGDFQVELDPEANDMKAWRIWDVIPDDQPIEDGDLQMKLGDAHKIDPEAKIGGDIAEERDPSTLASRFSAQIFEQEFKNNLRKAVNLKMLCKRLQQGDCLVDGTVNRVDPTSGDFVIEAKGVECYMRLSDAIPGENLQPLDRIRCLIREIKEDPNGDRMVYLTRTSDKFVKELFCDGLQKFQKDILEIVVAREPGYCSKVGVCSLDKKIIPNPEGLFIGFEGEKVNSIKAELRAKIDTRGEDNNKGENVHILSLDQPEKDIVRKALYPGKIELVREIDDGSYEAIVKDEENGAKAVGKSGKNLDLAMEVSSLEINVVKQDEVEDFGEEMIENEKNFLDELVSEEGVALYDEDSNKTEDRVERKREEYLKHENIGNDIFDETIAKAKDSLASANNSNDELLVRADENIPETVPGKDTQRFQIIRDFLNPQIATEAEIVRQASETISKRFDVIPEIAVVIGNGLGSLVEAIGTEESIDYADVPGFFVPEAYSHHGRMSLGTMSGKGVAFLDRLAYTYEGRNSDAAMRPLLSLAQLGVRVLLVANCAHALNPKFKIPSLMIVNDQICITGRDTATNSLDSGVGQRDFNIDAGYDQQLLADMRELTRNSTEVSVCEGVLGAVSSQTLKPNELRRMQYCGVDAVGMSSMQEVYAARQAKMRVIGLSALVHDATGAPTHKVMDIDALIDATQRIASSMATVLTGILARWDGNSRSRPPEQTSPTHLAS